MTLEVVVYMFWISIFDSIGNIIEFRIKDYMLLLTRQLGCLRMAYNVRWMGTIRKFHLPDLGESTFTLSQKLSREL
jgi:hypothetical protein